MAVGWLKNTLNELAQNGISKIRKKDLAQHLEFGYFSTDAKSSNKVILSWEEIVEELRKLEKLGYLEVTMEPQNTNSEQVCVELKSFMSGTPFPQGWIRD